MVNIDGWSIRIFTTPIPLKSLLSKALASHDRHPLPVVNNCFLLCTVCRWHGWMHHTFDEVPSSTPSLDNQYGKTSVVADALYNTHLGKVDNSEHIKYEQHNLSQYRHRGYNIGSLMTEAGEPEPYYKQPGHPLSPKADEGGRFQEKKYVTEANVKTIEFARRPRVNKK